MKQQAFYNEAKQKLHYGGNSLAVLTAECSASFPFGKDDIVIHFGLKASDVTGDWLEKVYSNFDGTLPEKQLPVRADEKLEWQETLISYSNEFASDKKRHIVILSNSETWMKRQAALAALVSLLEAGFSMEDSLIYLEGLNEEIAVSATEADIRAAIAMHERVFHLT